MKPIPPILFLAASAIAGTVLAVAVGMTPLPIAIAFTLCAGLSLLNGWKPLRGGVALPFLLVFLAGALSASLATEGIASSPLYSAARERRKIEVVGIVAREPLKYSDRTVLELAVERVKDGREEYTGSWTVRLSWELHCNAAGASPRLADGVLKIEAGDRIAFNGKASVAGGRDPELRERYFRKGIAAEFLLPADEIRLVEKRASGWLANVNDARSRIKRGVRESLDSRTAGFLVGVLIGDTSGLEDDIADDFRETGLSHLLAVSGMNVLFLVGALWPIFRAMRFPAPAQFLGLTLAIWFYAFLSQLSPSIVRATIMTEVGIIAWFTGRGRDPAAALGLAAFVMLLLQPFSIYDPGFQLSFAATFALILFSPVLEEKFKGVHPSLSSSMAACIAAQAGVMPVLAVHFGRLSVVTLPANLVALPAGAPAFVIGVFAALTSFIHPAFGRLLYYIAGLFSKYMIVVGHAFASLPAASAGIPTPGVITTVVYYAMLLAGAVLFTKWKGRLRFAHLLILLLLPIAVMTARQAAIASPPSGVELCFLDIGQGDATLIRDPSGATALVDAGPDRDLASTILDNRGVHRIDVAVITHPDLDHIGGMTEVVKDHTVGRLVLPVADERTPLLKELVDEAKARGVTLERVKRGDRYSLGTALIEVVQAEAAGESDNDASTVMRVTTGEFSALLAADIEEEAEQALLAKGSVRSTVLKVPHHGGAKSADKKFLEAVGARVAVISVGARNRYGHPTAKALNRLRAVGSEVYRTDRHGGVTIVTDGRTMEVKTEK